MTMFLRFRCELSDHTEQRVHDSLAIDEKKIHPVLCRDQSSDYEARRLRIPFDETPPLAYKILSLNTFFLGQEGNRYSIIISSSLPVPKIFLHPRLYDSGREPSVPSHRDRSVYSGCPEPYPGPRIPSVLRFLSSASPVLSLRLRSRRGLAAR